MSTNEPMTNHLHYIEHTHQAGDGILTKFICKGDRTSECHQWPSGPHDQCWMKYWMEDADCAETCCPDGEPVRSGPITVTFNGDCAEWEYADGRKERPMNDDQQARLEIMRALGEDFSDRLLEDLIHVARYVEHGGVEPELPEPDEPCKWASLADIPEIVGLVEDHAGNVIKRIVGVEHVPWAYANLDYEDFFPRDEDGPFIEVLS